VAKRNAIFYYPTEVRQYIDKQLAEGGYTFRELAELIAQEYGEVLAGDGKPPPSKSGIQRYSEDFEEAISEAREVKQWAEAFVHRLGDVQDGDTGRMLVQMAQSTAAKALIEARKQGPVDMKTLSTIAAAVQRLASADEIQVKRADLIRKRAREELIEEQKSKLDSLAKKGGKVAEAVAEIRREVYGV
jgi:Protein of unknown function (DUF3486)